MEPIYENIQPNIGSSFFMHCESPGCCEPFWHIHPEYELVYIKSGSAERHVGSSVSRYKDGDLLLIGSNIPHSNLGNKDHADNYEVVIQMSTEFVEKNISPFPEFSSIQKIFEMSNHGISFGKETRKLLGSKFENLDRLDAFRKLMGLIDILNVLANSNDYILLNAKSANIEIKSNDYARVNKINEFVAENFNRPILISELAELSGLTETSFSRFFKKVTGKTFICFLNEYRVQKACSFLTNKSNSISEVMEKSGFIDPAHFSRVFKKYTDYTPRNYQKKLKYW